MGDVHPISMASTNLSLTVLSTVLSVSFVVSATVFCSVTLLEKAALGAVVVTVVERMAWVERVARRRVVASVRKDILTFV